MKGKQRKQGAFFPKLFMALVMCAMLAALVGIGSFVPDEKKVDIGEEQIPLSAGEGKVVSQTDADKYIIPDKYNCGAQGSLTQVIAGETINGVKFKVSGGKNVMEFGYGNQNITGTVTFENMDFSKNDMGFYNEGKVDRDIKVVFKNCKFAQIKTGQAVSRMQYVFENCSFESFYGSNASFERCLFGESYRDAIIPFQNVLVKDCFIKDMSTTDTESAGIHSDGTQIYGYKDAKVKNVMFTNCRFEVPAIQTGGNSASVNACIMLQLEYNSGEDIHFVDCRINGGGYSIYARSVNPAYSLSNVTFENVEVGCAKLFKTVYSDVSPEVEFKNVKDTDALYIGTVWQESGKTHFSVSNDTNVDRTLIICTDSQRYSFTIPKCPNGKNLYMNFADYPFDIDISIPEVCRYAVCFDGTENQQVQVRFVNWSGKDVYLPSQGEPEKEVEDKNQNENTKTETSDIITNKVISTGTCGKDVIFILDNQGVLYLRGKGETYNYHSGKCAPWYEYRNQIVEVQIGEGITRIGNQSFRDCINLVHVNVADSIIKIGANAFIRCKSLQEITLPRKVREIGSYAFAATALDKSVYEGTIEGWSKVFVGFRNEELLRNLVYLK